jgi:DNA-binding transcriptional ArsR family regulator
VCDYFEISRIAVMKHLRVLERSELVISQKQGRTRQLYFNAVPIQLVYDRWTTEYSAYWAGKLTRIKYRIESAIEQPAKQKPLTTPSPAARKRHA